MTFQPSSCTEPPGRSGTERCAQTSQCERGHYGWLVVLPSSEWVDIGRGPRLHVLRWDSVTPDSHELPYLLVHGLGSNGRLWDGVAMALRGAGRRVVAVDLRGHGRSDKPDDGFDMATVADDVAALLDALGWPDPIVAGQSWGANVVIELAARHPQRCAAVVCVDGGTISLAERFATFDECWDVLAPPTFPADLTRDALERRMRTMHPDWPDSGIEGALACFEQLPDGTARPWLTRERHRLVLAGLYDHVPRERFSHISVPVLFVPADSGDVAWTHDKRAAIDAAVALLADGRVRWFSPADHDVHAQYPEEVAELLIELAAETRLGRAGEGA